jgi:hypothetical protein
MGPDATYRTLPCRPTIACTADLAPVGAFELEAGALSRKNSSGGRQLTLPFLAKLTVVDWLQLQLGSNGLTTLRARVSSQYFDDVLLGAKFQLRNQAEWVPSLSLSATASVPVFAGDAAYVRTYDAFFVGYVTKDFGPIHFDFNTGVNVWRIEGAPIGQELVALAVSAGLPAPFSMFGVMGETYYFTDASPVAPRDGGFLFAFAHSPRTWLTFDVGGDVGFFPSTRAYSVFVGMSLIPVILWRPAGR